MKQLILLLTLFTLSCDYSTYNDSTNYDSSDKIIVKIITLPNGKIVDCAPFEDLSDEELIGRYILDDEGAIMGCIVKEPKTCN